MKHKMIRFSAKFLCVIFLVIGVLVSCLSKGTESEEILFASLFSLLTPEIPETDLEGGDVSFTIHSISPTVIIENSQFTIEGKNLNKTNEKELFGDGYAKFLQFVEVLDDKITVSLHMCPSSKLSFPISGKNITEGNISIPCLGSSRFPLKSLKFDLGIEIDPIVGSSVVYPPQTLETLQTLGEIEFLVEGVLPNGISLHPESGELSGVPTETTENDFKSYPIIARLKANPLVKIVSKINLIVLSAEEKNNRKCRSISSTSTCRGPSPHVCTNSSLCYTSRLSCEISQKCGF
ncbi:hypothetical protein P3G55_14165 [Leptospira sp. 96542]|nr:hypothetical protein [Leptospira sp. 96542]